MSIGRRPCSTDDFRLIPIFDFLAKPFRLFSDLPDTTIRFSWTFAKLAESLKQSGNWHMSIFKRGGLSPLRLTQALSLLEDSLLTRSTVTQIAVNCGLSSSYFTQAFKASTGLSPYRWLVQRRLEKATELLAEATMPLSEVATRCGFVDQAHFAKAFRKSTGVPPSVWRRGALSADNPDEID